MRYPIMMSRERYECLYGDEPDTALRDVTITVNEASVEPGRLNEMYTALLNHHFNDASLPINEIQYLNEGDYLDDYSKYYTLRGKLTACGLGDVESILDGYDARYTVE